MSAPVVLAAGGTGGHVFPAQALAEELGARGCRLVLVTDRRGRSYGGSLGRIETHYIHAGSLRCRRLERKLLELGHIALGIIEARRLLGRLRPSCVVGFGGYPSMPTMLAATRMGLPTVIHEQNAVLGRTNRFLVKRAGAIATSFVTTARLDANALSKTTHTGNPIRPAISALSGASYAAPDNRGPLRLFVLGGSQGARVFGTVVPQALAGFPQALRSRLEVTQQCRGSDLEKVRETYAAAGIVATLSAFFEDVVTPLGAAHLVISRAGASTIAELAVSGRPAILVPYPFASDDHQLANARALAETGAARLIPQREFTPESLARCLKTLLAEPEGLVAAAEKARALGRPDAAATLADVIERLTGSDGAARGKASDRQGSEERAA